MNKFKIMYRADLSRYKGKPDLYLKLFHFFYRKAIYSNYFVVRFVCKIIFRFWANLRGLEFTTIEQIGEGLYIGHPYNITINQNAKIGSNCNIHKGVVIGQVNRGARKGCPTIGDRVWIGINSAIVGKVSIGDDVLIAPNSFVNVDVPSHSIVFGNPCVIKHRVGATEGYVNNCV